MPRTSPARADLIQRIGNVIVRIDIWRSGYSRTNARRVQLDNFRDQLDACQRMLVRKAFKENTAKFIDLTDKLKKTDEKLQKALDDVTAVADTLDLVGKFLDVATKLVSLG